MDDEDGEFSLILNNRTRPWNTMPEVIQAQMMHRLTRDQIKLQEAKFEIISSEAAYLQKLRVLENHYMKNIYLGNLASDDDLRLLFGNVRKMRESCDRFVRDLKDHWKEDILLGNLTAIIFKHVIELNTFQNFIDYVKQYPKQMKCLRALLDAGGMFQHCIETLQNHMLSQKLSIDSFLILPVKQATRYALLMEAVAKHMDEDHDEFDGTLMLVDILRKLAEECNTNLKLAENRERMSELSRQLRTPSGMRPVVLISESRFIVDQTKVRRINVDRSTMRKETLEMFLFNDLLLVLKKESGRSGSDKYVVVDYSAIANVECVIPRAGTSNANMEARGVVLCLMSNHRGERTEMMLSFDHSSRDEWISTLNAVKNPTMQEYKVIKGYKKLRKHDLSLSIGDILFEVEEAPVHGFLKGTKVNSQDSGWFPAECVEKAGAVPASTEEVTRRRQTKWYDIDPDGEYDHRQRTTTWYSDPF